MMRKKEYKSVRIEEELYDRIINNKKSQSINSYIRSMLDYFHLTQTDPNFYQELPTTALLKEVKKTKNDLYAQAKAIENHNLKYQDDIKTKLDFIYNTLKSNAEKLDQPISISELENQNLTLRQLVELEEKVKFTNKENEHFEETKSVIIDINHTIEIIDKLLTECEFIVEKKQYFTQNENIIDYYFNIINNLKKHHKNFLNLNYLDETTYATLTNGVFTKEDSKKFLDNYFCLFRIINLKDSLINYSNNI